MPLNQRFNDINHYAIFSKKINVLHVENSLLGSQPLCKRDNKSNRYSVDNAKDLSEAKKKLNKNHYQVIFLDLNLPDSTGVNSLICLRSLDDQTPIIILTDDENETISEHIIRCGAQDFIHKDEFNIKVIDRCVNNAIERKKIEIKLQETTEFDALTKLANRQLFMNRLKNVLLNKRQTNSPYHTVVILIDLDNFKIVNNTLGHTCGDHLLIQVANRLKCCVRESDTVARLGGNEFSILIEQVEHLNKLTLLTNKILDTLAAPFFINNKSLYTLASIGVASSIELKSTDPDILLKNANIAMYSAKRKGGNQTGYFTKDLQVATHIRNNLEKSLQAAIKKQELQLYFQPQINIETGVLSGAEALLRWKHPQHGIIPPDGFISTLEDTGLIIPATEWAISKTLELWHQWLLSGRINSETHIAINISPKFIRNINCCDTITKICNASSVKPEQIVLELTENCLINSTPQNFKIFTHLREKGFNLSIDDFGTGYSSLSYLKAFPISTLKLDRLFVKDIIGSRTNIAIAESIVQLCQQLDITLIAEGVDSWEKLMTLREMGCKIIQGHFYSRPLNQDDFYHYLHNYRGSKPFTSTKH